MPLVLARASRVAYVTRLVSSASSRSASTLAATAGTSSSTTPTTANATNATTPTSSDDTNTTMSSEHTTPPERPPSPPNPSEDTGLIPNISSPVDQSAIPSPPINGVWDANDILPETAMKMLCRFVQALANANGEIPPTPPIRRTASGNRLVELKTTEAGGKENSRRHHRRTSSRPATPVPSDDIKAPNFLKVDVGSPEATEKEPATPVVGADAVEAHAELQAIARKFFCRVPPPVTLEQYFARLQRYCPMSTAVWLAAGTYIFRLSVEERVVPCTARTMHRLVLGCLRVAMKALEDLRYPQDRFAGVGGVKDTELHLLEVAVCYLMDFDLQVSNEQLYRRMLAFQQAAFQASLISRQIPASEMKLKIPMRVNASAQTA
ncbi:uncharacterized protein PV09_03313 [Verruconis gallopava]|uniref:Cyclin-like domain-containing protein n=1 Tax=Verruconis gallopava TaxID=253628 RepID=A0A0D1XTQ8_9PEZI|nr:uncharacterized protein PV09_03313 [Verruconis gallopava]KIW06151.1 hypothetical protein PV09_03313 [Verruconis gallopava]